MVKIGLPLKFNYPMMSLIRELIAAERHRVWMEHYAPNLKRSATAKENYTKIIEDCRNPLLRQGLCNLILDECNNMEDLIQANLRGRNIFCDTCGEERWVINEEQNVNKEFIHLPRWRELSCGHIINPFGKLAKKEGKNNG